MKLSFLSHRLGPGSKDLCCAVIGCVRSGILESGIWDLPGVSLVAARKTGNTFELGLAFDLLDPWHLDSHLQVGLPLICAGCHFIFVLAGGSIEILDNQVG